MEPTFFFLISFFSFFFFLISFPLFSFFVRIQVKIILVVYSGTKWGLVREGGGDDTVSFMVMEWEKREGMRAWGNMWCGHLNYLPLDIFSYCIIFH